MEVRNKLWKTVSTARGRSAKSVSVAFVAISQTSESVSGRTLEEERKWKYTP